MKNHPYSTFQLYQLDELKSSNYQANTCNCNKFGTTFPTFGHYANWLENRVDETLSWYLNNGYWHSTEGIKTKPSASAQIASINKQVGFGRALLFMGLTTGKSSYKTKAMLIANLFKGNVTFYDPCEDQFYNASVFRLTPDNGYWWYHAGWSVPRRDCGVWSGFPPSFTYYFKAPKYSGFVEYIEDVSHGAIVTWLPLDFYDFQPNTPFTQADMIRFRNTFTKNLYDSGQYHTGTDGTDGTTFIEDRDPPYSQKTIDQLRTMNALSYMPLAEFDGADGTANPPNAYETIMDFYISDIKGSLGLPSGYGGQINKGHAEVVKTQWQRECPNLELYNRKVVYNQNFFAKGELTIDGAAGPVTDSYADPIIQDQKFIIEPGNTVNITSPTRITLKNFHAKEGSKVHAYINSSLCSSNGSNKKGNSKSGKNNDNKQDQPSSSPTSNEKVNLSGINLKVYPNPFTDNTVIEFSLSKPGRIRLTVYDNTGKPVVDQIENKKLEKGIYKVPFHGNGLSAGIYHCILTVDNKVQFSERIIKN